MEILKEVGIYSLVKQELRGDITIVSKYKMGYSQNRDIVQAYTVGYCLLNLGEGKSKCEYHGQFPPDL